MDAHIGARQAGSGGLGADAREATRQRRGRPAVARVRARLGTFIGQVTM